MKPAFTNNVKQGEIGRALYYETPPKKRLIRFVDYSPYPAVDNFIVELQFPYIQLWPSFFSGFPHVTCTYNPLTREEPLYSLPLPHIDNGLICIKRNWSDPEKQLDSFWKQTFILNYARGRYKKQHIDRWAQLGKIPEPVKLLNLNAIINSVLTEQG